MSKDTSKRKATRGSGRGLGRGLDLLISREAVAARPRRAGVECVAVGAIAVNPEQPRRHFDAGELTELTASLQRYGVISPLLVRREGRGFILIAGERRLRAAKAAGLTEVPVLVRLDADSAELQLELALVENLQRADLDAIDAALGYQRLIEAFDQTQEAVAVAVGKDRSTVANAVRLLRLPEAVLTLVREGAISAGHARALLPLIGTDGLPLDGLEPTVEAAKKLSVRATETLVRQVLANEKSGAEASISGLLNERQQRLQATRPAAKKMTTALAAEVVVRPRKRGGGRIVISYADPAELERLVGQLSGGSVVAE